MDFISDLINKFLLGSLIFVFIVLILLAIGIGIHSYFAQKRAAELAQEARLPIYANNKGVVLISKEKAQQDCSICLEKFSDQNTAVMLGHCEHMFHVPCIVQWTAQSKTCPICRKVVDRVVVSKIREQCDELV